MTNRLPGFWATYVLLTLATGTATQAQGLITDRPDFTESGVVVPKGSVQVEAGVTLENSSTSAGVDESLLVLGEALIRWGVFTRLEARIESPNYNRISSGGASTAGFDDLRIGAKYQIGPFGEAADFDLGVIGKLSIPTGDEDIANDPVVPEVILSASKPLTQELVLGGQVFASLPDDGAGRSISWGATVVGAVGIGAVGVFVELFVEVPEDGTAPMMAHTGLVIPLGLKFQLDIHGGFGLTDTAPNNFLGGGFSFAL